MLKRVQIGMLWTRLLYRHFTILLVLVVLFGVVVIAKYVTPVSSGLLPSLAHGGKAGVRDKFHHVPLYHHL
jgi:hypothetical protein